MSSRFPDAPDLIDETEEPPGDLPGSRESAFSGRLPLAGALILALVAEGFLALSLVFSNGQSPSLVEVGVPLISGLFALGCCLLAGMVLRGRERGAWMLLGLACLGVLVAEGARLVPSSIHPGNFPLVGQGPSVATVALIAQSIVLFLAFLLFPPPAQDRATLLRLRLFFDGVLVIGSALVGAGYFIVLPLVQETDSASNPVRLTTLTICVADLLLLAGVLFALRSAGERGTPLRGALRVLALGALLLIATDAAGLIQNPLQPALMNSWLQVVWNAGYLCLGLGALLRLRSESQPPAALDLSIEEAERPALWLTLPFALTIIVAGGMMAHALLFAADMPQLIAAVICISLLVALIGARHLVGLFEARRLSLDSLLLARELALATDDFDQLHNSQAIQAEQRQQTIIRLQETLTRFGYGEYDLRAEILESELAPLVESVNVLLEGIERQRGERDRAREVRLVRTLTDALGRLALGELHDLPSLPALGTGGGLDDLVRGVIQVRTRLLNLEQQLQQQEAERQEVEQQFNEMSQRWEEEANNRRQETLQVNQMLEARLQTEYQVAQASQDQLQRDLQRTQAQLRAAEEQARASEAALAALEEQMRGERLALEQERLDLEEQLRTERQMRETLQQQASQPVPAQPGRLREQSERLVGQLSGQAERLHMAAAALQTAAEVAQRLSRTLEETAALPDLQAAAPAAAPGAAPPPAAPARPLSAMQMLERMAGLRKDETAPQPAVSPAASAPSGPLGETPGDRVAQRLRGAAGRAEEIARGLLELAQQFIATGEETERAAEETSKLAEGLKQGAQVPASIPRTTLPPRPPRSGR